VNNLTLFVIGAIVTVPTATVIVGLLFAAGIDERAERKDAAEALAAAQLA
jgi:hypothetical protein